MKTCIVCRRELPERMFFSKYSQHGGEICRDCFADARLARQAVRRPNAIAHPTVGEAHVNDCDCGEAVLELVEAETETAVLGGRKGKGQCR